MSTAVLPTLVPEPELAPILRAYNDVTERLKRSHEALAREVCRLREELREKNKELQRRERLAALGQMAAGVAHEIRNPLGGVGLYISLLERDLRDRPAQLDILRKMSAGLRNLDSVVSDILAFAGDVEPNRYRTPLDSIITAVLEQTLPLVETRGVRVHVDPALREKELDCDPGQIERALLNLLFNAIDAVGEDGCVWLRHERGSPADGVVRIAVDDNGPGVPPELRQKVFDPFFTGKGSGTGLGLAIVHRIAESHGGSISVRPRRGGGASFVLSVPRADQCPGTDVQGEQQ